MIERVLALLILQDWIRSVVDQEPDQVDVSLGAWLTGQHQRRQALDVGKVDVDVPLDEQPGAVQTRVGTREAVMEGVPALVVLAIDPGVALPQQAGHDRVSTILAGVHERRHAVRIGQVVITSFVRHQRLENEGAVVHGAEVHLVPSESVRFGHQFGHEFRI